MKIFVLGLMVVMGATGCKKKAVELPPSITVTSAVAGIGPMKGQVRLDESHTPLDAKVFVEGVEAKNEGGGTWAPLPEAKRKPGKYTLKIEVVATSADGKEQRASTTADVEVTAGFTVFKVTGSNKGNPLIGCEKCDPTYATYDPSSLEVAFTLKAEAGDKIEWEGKPQPSTGAPINVAFRFGRIADVAVADLIDPRKGIPLPLKVSNPAGGTSESPWLNGVDGAAAVFGKLAKGPVDIGDGAPATGADRNALILSKVSSYKSKVLGNAAKVRDVDLVALLDSRLASKTSCGSYANKAGQTATFYFTRWDVDVLVYDRRSAKLRGKKTFAAPGTNSSCPKEIKGSSGDASYGDTAAAEKWIASFVKS